MGKLITFFHVFKKSFSSPAYYSDMLKTPFRFSLKFFFFYFFLYALAGTLFLVPKISPLKNYVLYFPSQLEKVYPNELEIQIVGGEVSTNVEEPFYLPLKDVEKVFSGNKVLGTSTPQFANLLVIDTRAAIEDFEKYRTVALLTKKNLVMYDNKSSGYKVTTFKDMPDMKINRQFIQDLLFKLNPIINNIANFLIPGLALLIFLGMFIFLPLLKFFYLLFFTLLILLIGKVISQPISYKNGYRIGMHLIIIPTTLFGIFSLFGFNVSFPFLQTIIMTALAIAVLTTIKGSPKQVSTSGR